MNSNYINRRYFSIVAVPSYTHTHTHKDFTIMMNNSPLHTLDTNTQTTMWVAKTPGTVRFQAGLACSSPEQSTKASVML